MKHFSTTIALTFLTCSAALANVSQISGAWRGPWADTRGSQHGELAVMIGTDGQMTGAVSNKNINILGEWVGQILETGQMQANYTYGTNGPYTAVGRFALSQRGELVGNVNFLAAGRIIGIGVFQLARTPQMVSAVAQAAQICVIYPTACHPPAGPSPQTLGVPAYPGNSPIYTPQQLAPALGMVARSGLDALPSDVRHALYPPQLAQMVRSGQVDAATQQAMGNAQQLMGIINGTGPGGAYYTNKAAIDLLRGDSLIWQLGSILSPYALPLDNAARTRLGAR